ncbi:MAG: hypothetical protein LBJ61_11645 [Deltaproteobacteria bacterium]|jgi:hypothetical protein|nr:hypothetical protein [Deltaproteobacteria bacterium]
MIPSLASRLFPFLVPALALAFLLVPGCGLNRGEYDRQRDIRSEFLAQLTEIRQANEIIGRNITSTYQEIEVLRSRIQEREADLAAAAVANIPAE